MDDLLAARIAKYLRDLYDDGDMALAGDSNDVEHDALYAIVDGLANILDWMGCPVENEE